MQLIPKNQIRIAVLFFHAAPIFIAIYREKRYDMGYMKELSADFLVSKLIVLYLLDKMEIPILHGHLVDICTGQNSWINYMECVEILSELQEVGFIYNLEKEKSEEKRFAISYEGRNCLSHFYRRIPLEVRGEITEFAAENRGQVKRSQEYLSSYEKLEDGSFKLTLRIKDPITSSSLFELSLKAPTKSAAAYASATWMQKAPYLYEQIFGTLMDDGNPL